MEISEGGLTQWAARAFVTLSYTLGDDHDADDFFRVLVETCVDLLGVWASGLLIVAEYGGVGMSEVFEALRGHARARRLRLADVAAAVADGILSPAEVLGRPDQTTPPG